MPSTALHGCRIDRALVGRVEMVEASNASRRFPPRVTERLGICLKSGPAQRVMADGREVVYPEDATCIRPPGCVWSADATGPVGLISIDLAPSLLPSDLSCATMAFARPSALPEAPALARVLRAGGSQTHLEELVAELTLAIGASGLASADDLRRRRRLESPLASARRSRAPSRRPRPSRRLADDLGTSRFALLRRFKRDFGVTPHVFVLRLRVDRERERLARGGDLVAICASAGYTALAMVDEPAIRTVAMVARWLHDAIVSEICGGKAGVAERLAQGQAARERYVTTGPSTTCPRRATSMPPPRCTGRATPSSTTSTRGADGFRGGAGASR